MLARRGADQINRAEDESQPRHQSLQAARDFGGKLCPLPATLFRRGPPPVRLPAHRAARVERAREGFARHPRDAQLARLRYQLLKDHRTMAQRLGVGEVFFAHHARVDEERGGVHADREWAQELSHHPASVLGEELPGRGGVVGDERARDAQAGTRGEAELPLLVLRRALSLGVVDPARAVQRVEKSFERGGGLPDAHLAEARVEVCVQPRRPEFTRPDGKLSTASQSFARLAFGEAADRHVASRTLDLAPSSLAKEKQLLVKPREFFQATSLNRISAERILAYREWRSAQGVGPTILNMEVGVLRRILKRAKLWHMVADDVKPLREPHTIGRAMMPDQKQKLLETASKKPEWETAYWAAILALNTTMRGCEIRSLLWSDINLPSRSLTIRKSKTEAGGRVIPLTQDAYNVLVQLRARAEMFGQVEPSHFVFAGFRVTGRFDGKEVVETRITSFDPTRHIGSWRKAWRNLTRKAGLGGLRFHDLRHHAITELAESGESEQTILAIGGHVDRRMLEQYSHIRMEAKRKALEALSSRSGNGYGTNGGTKTEEEASVPPFLAQIW